MAEKQSIFGRIAQLTKANLNAMLDAAEDPELMLDQLIRDYTDNIAEAQDAVAQTIGNLRLMEQDFAEDQRAVAEWGAKALAASRKADELRAGGDVAGAQKFDDLAKLALKKQLDFEEELSTAGPAIAAQTQMVEKLKTGLEGMKVKLGELKQKRDELVGRAKIAEAQNQVQDAISSISLTDPTSELSRFEEKIRREEARAAGNAELAASSLDSQFASIEDAEVDLEVEARLAALKAGGTAAVGPASSASAPASRELPSS